MGRRRTKWRYLEEQDDEGKVPLHGLCVRLNPAAAKMWPHWPEQHNRYQVFRKCLYTKRGVCRRCGCSKTRPQELKE